MAALSFNLEKMQLALNNNFVKIYRFKDDPDVPWFQSKPIIVYLDYKASHVTQTLQLLDDDEKSSLEDLIKTKGQPLEGDLSDRSPLGYNDLKAFYVSEPGLYSLIGKSTKTEAKVFKRWVHHDVLPSIRKNGSYTLATTAVVTAQDIEAIMNRRDTALSTTI
jgi:prophage antirepressor-like protein